ncbi:alpha/beta hydrolase [Owenweeksia hongkongensis]|uniref:alpha/beta hydrolase n=1 Tax=Owenweeksia hongkongensis TaxID=253245 RepID=UPI003A8FDEF2
MKTVITSLFDIFLSLNFCLAQNIIRVEEELSFIWNKDTLYGTLLSQGKDGKKINKLPVMLIIPGSGPTDRDGNSQLIPGTNNSFKLLADSLLNHGIATFRYDKMGVGKSQFSGTEEDLRFEDNVEIASSAIQALKKLGFKKIYIIGHSQGSLVGMLTAQQNKVKGFISLEGSGINAYTLLQEQLKKNLPVEMQESTFQKMDSIKNGYPVTKYNPALASLLRESLQPYLRSYFRYAPTEEIAKLKIPILIIQGGQDLQTTTKEGEMLKEAAPKAEYLYLKNMNHVLKMVDESEEQNRAAYTDPDFPLPKELVNKITNWVKSN